MNPSEDSYRRLGSYKTPRFVSWSVENRSQLVRIPAATGAYRRAELRSPDPGANPYLAFALLIHAGLEGIANGYVLPEAADLALSSEAPQSTPKLAMLPQSYSEACAAAYASSFIKEHIPAEILSAYGEKYSK